jgi:hypothetical protein
MSDAAWSHALWHPQASVPPGWVAHNGSDATRRLAVYRNNVVVSLLMALAETYPIVRLQLGDAAFFELAHQHVLQSPPCSAVMAHYGAAFAELLAGHAVAHEQPYLPDLARLEYARVRCFHAADAPALPIEALQGRLAQPETLADWQPSLAPCVEVLQARWPIFALWASATESQQAQAIGPAQSEAMLVCRDGWDAVVIRLSPAQARFIQALQAHQPLGRAAQQALAHDAQFDLGLTLGLLIQQACLTQEIP